MHCLHWSRPSCKLPFCISCSFPSSVSHSLGKTKLRSSQRLQLMKLQAEAESARMCMPQKKSSAEMMSIPATTNGAFLSNLQHHYSVTPSPRSSGTIPPNLHDYAAMHSRSTVSESNSRLWDFLSATRCHWKWDPSPFAYRIWLF